MKQKTPWLYTMFGFQLGAKQVQVEPIHVLGLHSEQDSVSSRWTHLVQLWRTGTLRRDADFARQVVFLSQQLETSERYDLSSFTQ
jgi:hypothetical protein